MRIRNKQQRVERRRHAQRLASLLLAGTGLMLAAPAPPADSSPTFPPMPVERVPALAPAIVRVDEPHRAAGPQITLVLPPPRPAFRVSHAAAVRTPARPMGSPPDAPVRLVASVAPPLPVLDLPAPAPIVPAPPTVPVATLRQDISPADIAQVASLADSTPYPVQLNEPSSGATIALNDRIAAMQVAAPPPVRLSRTEQALLLAASPDRLQVRRGGQALGSVAFEIAATRAIAVRLGDILDLVAADLPPAELARLQGSSAAGTFVPLETLREAGVDLRYDPVYDEFRLAG